MTQPFTLIHLAAWLDLIEQARRFRNPKVCDPARLKAAGNRAMKTVLPPRYQSQRGSCFHRLERVARTTGAYGPAEREALLFDARACLEHLVEIASMVSSTQDRLAALADSDWSAFRIEIGNHMFPGARQTAAASRLRADIDG